MHKLLWLFTNLALFKAEKCCVYMWVATAMSVFVLCCATKGAVSRWHIHATILSIFPVRVSCKPFFSPFSWCCTFVSSRLPFRFYFPCYYQLRLYALPIYFLISPWYLVCLPSVYLRIHSLVFRSRLDIPSTRTALSCLAELLALFVSTEIMTCVSILIFILIIMIIMCWFWSLNFLIYWMFSKLVHWNLYFAPLYLVLLSAISKCIDQPSSIHSIDVIGFCWELISLVFIIIFYLFMFIVSYLYLRDCLQLVLHRSRTGIC